MACGTNLPPAGSPHPPQSFCASAIHPTSTRDDLRQASNIATCRVSRPVGLICRVTSPKIPGSFRALKDERAPDMQRFSGQNIFFPVLIVRHQLVKTGLSESQSKRMLSSHSEGTNTSELFQNLNLSLSRPSTA